MKYLVAGMLLFAIAISCKKELSFTSDGSLGSLDNFFKANQLEEQSFTLSDKSGGTFKGKEGGKFYFMPNSFVDKNGKAIDGNIQLKIQEVYTPGDMILANLPTMSDGKLLESGGEFNIRAMYNGEEVKLAPGKYIRIGLPGKDLGGMQVFNGSVTGNNSVNWVPNNNGVNSVQADSLRGSGYNMFCDSVHWLNCDAFLYDPKISCLFYPGNSPDADSTRLFLHFTGRNSVVGSDALRANSFSFHGLIAAPVTIVGICYLKGKLYSSLSTATLKDNANYTLNFTETTSDELKDQLKKLK